MRPLVGLNWRIQIFGFFFYYLKKFYQSKNKMILFAYLNKEEDADGNFKENFKYYTRMCQLSI